MYVQAFGGLIFVTEQSTALVSVYIEEVRDAESSVLKTSQFLWNTNSWRPLYISISRVVFTVAPV